VPKENAFDYNDAMLEAAIDQAVGTERARSVLQQITPETPKDTLVLVWGPEGFSVAAYDGGNSEWYAEAAGELAHNYSDLVCPNPTHWMPLPAAPVQSS
jgi:hypothetical protein